MFLETSPEAEYVKYSSNAIERFSNFAQSWQCKMKELRVLALVLRRMGLLLSNDSLGTR